jgi:antitoxin ParD1/3/4
VTSLNISLPESLRAYIEGEVSRGGYSTPSEYVRELVRADQKRKSEDHLEALLLKGLRSGKPTAMTKKDWTELRKRVFEGRAEKTRRRA